MVLLNSWLLRLRFCWFHFEQRFKSVCRKDICHKQSWYIRDSIDTPKNIFQNNISHMKACFFFFFSFMIQGSDIGLIFDSPSFLWSICSHANCWIWHREKKSWNLIGYSPRNCKLRGISSNALTHVIDWSSISEISLQYILSKPKMTKYCLWLTPLSNIQYCQDVSVSGTNPDIHFRKLFLDSV